MSRRTLLIYICGLFFIAFTAVCLADDDIEDCKDTEVTVVSQPCDSAPCNISCTATFNGKLFKVVDDKWMYYTTDESESVVIFNTVYKTDEGNVSSLVLLLTDFYSGQYRCYFEFNKTEGNTSKICSAYKDVPVLPTPGVEIGDPCTVKSECAALNATCDAQSKCNCEPDDIMYINDTKTPACLSESEPNATCNIDSQCTASLYFCIDYECTCSAYEVKVKAANGILCINASRPTETCQYDEECTLFDGNTYCNTTCQCNAEYTEPLDENLHCMKPWEMTDADIAAVAVAGVFALGIIAIVIRCIAEACCCRDNKKKIEEEVA